MACILCCFIRTVYLENLRMKANIPAKSHVFHLYLKFAHSFIKCSYPFEQCERGAWLHLCWYFHYVSASYSQFPDVFISPDVVLLNQFSPFRNFPKFSALWNTSCLYNITFILDRCNRSSVAETPDKYESDLKYSTYTFVKSNIPVTMELTNRALVPPTRNCNNM